MPELLCRRLAAPLAMALAALLAGPPASASGAPEPAGDGPTAAAALARRLLGDRAQEFTFTAIDPEEGRDVFEIEAASGQVSLRGSSGVALASALHWYLKYHGRAHVSWCGSQLGLPRPLPDAPRVRIATPYKYRYYFNYCAFSYTMAWWDWARWEREIDWMALHGINMPLAVTGQEAVWQQVHRRLGLSDAEAAPFFVGPGYLPFGWMGCIDGWGGPLPQGWIDSHADLARKILRRERQLGMTPVLQGFTGHVSAALGAKHPEMKLLTLPSWCGFAGTRFLDPATPAFREVGKTFLEEQTRLFGTDHLYASDTFIEMSPPSNDPAFLAGMAKAVYESMAAADDQAVWVMQGWIFVNNPGFWKPPQGKAFLGAVPDDRMVLLDLFCDTQPAWVGTESFHGKPWVWCVIHSFGGATGLFGDLATLANGPPAALESPKRGRLSGLGLMMEAFGHNPIYYELATEMAWRTRPPEPAAWVRDYAHARYGKAVPQADEAWQILRQTAYSAGFVDSVLWQRPSPAAAPPSPPYEPERLAKAWELLLASANELGGLDPYQYDVADVGRQVLSNLASPLQAEMMAAWRRKDAARFKAAAERFLQLIRDLDGLLATREEFLLGKWIADATRWGQTDPERRLFEWNARNQITLWGPRASGLHEYARKQWSGLLAGFYLRRWEMFIQRAAESLEKGQPFDAAAFERDVTAWEEAWTHQNEPYPATPAPDTVRVARTLFDKYQPVLKEAYKPESPSLTTGRPTTCSAALPGFPASLANDGRLRDTNRYWATDVQQDKAAWWQVDLEKPTVVGRIVVVGYFADRRSYGFTVEASNDGRQWDMVADRRDNKELSSAEGYTCPFPPRPMRYVRVTMTANSANTGRHLVEVQAFEK